MTEKRLIRTLFLSLTALLLAALPSRADIVVQCPGDNNGDAIPDKAVPGKPQVKCMHLTSGDGFIKMADGKLQYIFGFSDVTGVRAREVLQTGALAANFPAPLIEVNQNDEFYLNLSNVAFVKRPDLFDPHTVHWHGFPQTGAIFDGLPESAIAINVGSTATYYYKALDPGTYMYHCHAEATEHMQMGMLGNLYVRPVQNGTPIMYQGRTYNQFAYNDGDGSTGYNVQLPLQLTGFDPDFHDASITVQPLPFALMRDKYPMMNGRGYPDTLNPLPLAAPAENGGKQSQRYSSLLSVTAGQRILLRLSNLNVTRPYTLKSLGIPMQVVGRDAKLLRGPSGRSLYYTTNSIHLGSGEAADVILDTLGIAPGTYFLHAAELNYLSNNLEDFGGMMTEIRVN
jgi:FtsP/CotA-like multicopper oxidase with cupredoxin domain